MKGIGRQYRLLEIQSGFGLMKFYLVVIFNTSDVSFIRLHEMYNRATPEKFVLYKHALQLFKLFNTNDHTTEWVELNFNQINTSRHLNFITCKSNLKKVGLNALANRLYIINNQIPLTMLNKSYDTYKVFCKKIIL